MEDEPGQLECYLTKSRLFVVVFGGICFSAGSIVLIVNSQIKVVIAGCLGLTLFGLGTISIIYRALKRGPAIIIDAVGFEDTRTGIGIIPWEEIKTLNVIHKNGVTIISLESTDEDELLTFLPWYRKLWFKFNGWYLGISPIYTYVIGLSHSLDEIIDFISDCDYLTTVDIDDESWPDGVVLVNPLHTHEISE